MGDLDEIGVSTGAAERAAATAGDAADLYDQIDVDFRAVIHTVGEAVVEAPVTAGTSMFGEQRSYDLVRLREHMCGVSGAAGQAGQAASATDRGNAERYAPHAA